MVKFKYLPFFVFTLSIFIVLIIPVLVQDGMFMDGMLYTCVSHNLARGIGSFWNPVFSETYFTSSRHSFHEHPPLVFAIQSVFFRLFGDSMYVERLYSFITACISALLISRIWILLSLPRKTLSSMSWLPVLFWIIVPVSYWAFQNNMQENTMGIFILLSVFYSLRVLIHQKKPVTNLMLAGFFIFLATLCKGVPGFFPLGIFFLFLITHPRNFTFGKMLKYTSITFAVPLIIYAFLMLWPEARESLSFYVNERLIGRVATTPTVDNRFDTLIRLFMELLPVIILVFLLVGMLALKRIPLKINSAIRKQAVFLFLLGLSGSLPIMLTMVQKAFYFTPSLPFFALSFALLIAPPLHQFLAKLTSRKSFYYPALVISILLLAGVLIFSGMQIGKTSRNADLLHDVYTVGKIVPPNSIINIDASMWNEWDLQCYFIRYFYISVDPTTPGHEFIILNKTLHMDSIKGYRMMDVGLRKYQLFRKDVNF